MWLEIAMLVSGSALAGGLLARVTGNKRQVTATFLRYSALESGP